MSQTIWFNANIHPDNVTQNGDSCIVTAEIVKPLGFSGKYEIEYKMNDIILPNGKKLVDAKDPTSIIEQWGDIRMYRGDGEHLENGRFKLDSIRAYGYM